MPCDIGYRSIADIEIDAKETIETRTRAPAIDRQLMDQLGVDDPVFLAWAQELDLQPLLEKALERTLDEIGSGDMKFRIEDGVLVSSWEAKPPLQRSQALRMSAPVIALWQFEILRIVCELLDYECSITIRGNERLLEGEKHGASGVHEYIAITNTANGLTLRFEHFSSEDALTLEQRKFRALAQRFGLRIHVVREKRDGQAIPPGTIHPHKHRGKA